MLESNRVALCGYFLKNLELLHWRDYLQELLTIPERQQAFRDGDTNTFTLTMEHTPYVGKLVEYDGALWSVTDVKGPSSPGSYKVSLAETGIVPVEDEALVKPNDPITLPPGVIANYTDGPPMETTIGRVILNHMILAVPFGNTIAYINKLWDSGLLEKIVGDLIIREQVTVEQVNTYIANLYFLGHAPELVVPNLSEKSLTTDPNIALRKKELLEEHKDALAAGDAVVMSQIEQELIAMDKAYLKGDSSMGYYIKGVAFSVHRKKLLLTHGMVEAFGDVGHYDFVPNALEDGWTVDDFPKIANEIRAGSYSRAKETAKGGEESKFLSRVFMGARVIEDDCGTDDTLDVIFRSDNSPDYIYRNRVTESGVEPLTAESANALIGTKVKIRSPLFCTTQGGYCFTCMGQMFKTLDQKVLATASTAIGAQLTVTSLKRMHGTSISTVEIKSLNEHTV